MKPLFQTRLWKLFSLALVIIMMGNAQAAGLLTPTSGSLPSLDIKSHHVSVIIEDGYAITTVEQLFHNPHDHDLEAVYSFPVPEHGSVAEFTLWIDGKPVSGEVLEKKRARQVYEEEKKAGRDAGLTEKDSYRTFDISVWPVRAGQDTRTRLVYLQPAHIDTGIGRYVYPLEEGGVDEQKLTFWTANDKVTESFSFDLLIRSAYPVEAVRLPNQPQALITQQGEGEWHIQIGNQSTAPEGMNTIPSTAAPVFTLDKDLVVYWRHKEGLPGSVDLVTYKPEAGKRGTFMMVLTPGDDLKPITEGRDYVFVLDVSGSMQGKYATLAEGVDRALNKMRPEDRFRIVLFNSSARELTSGYVNATVENIRHYGQAVAQVSPDSGTNLYGGIKLGLNLLDADRTSAIVLVTDGVANVGETQQRNFVDLIKKKDVRLFTFIMGNSANRPLLEMLTRESGGFAASISNSDDIVGQLLAATSKLTHEALHGVKVNIKGVKTADITPQRIGSLYRGQQLVILGHYWGDGPAQIELSGKISGQPKSYKTLFDFPAQSSRNPELERLWAYATIEKLTEEIHDFGEEADLKNAIVDLGVEYGLVTDYTSMLVVRDEVFDTLGIERKNRVRLEKEWQAQQQRTQQSVQSSRADSQQPMFTGSRATYSGSGAMDGWMLLLAFPLILIALRNSGKEIG